MIFARCARAREEQADKLFREIIEIADDASGDYVTTSDGKRIVDHENIQRSRPRVDARKWAAARLAPKKYGDHISHDVKGPGANFQPAILITVDGQPHDEFARQLAYDEGGGVLLDGNGGPAPQFRTFQVCPRTGVPLYGRLVVSAQARTAGPILGADDQPSTGR